MGTERPSKDQVFNSAAELADPLERAEFLDMACAGNPDLRIEMEDLLARDREAASFLQSPPSDLLASAPRSATIETPATIEMPGAVIGPYKLLEQIGEL
jgi:hypothetical protein